jgi:hypothetical protein
MKKLLLLSGLALALLLAVPNQSRAQLGGGLLGGGTVGGTLQNLRNRMTNRNPSIQYDPSVLTPGTPRDEVLAVFGNPNGSQNVNGVQQDVFAFYPNGDKYVDPQITAGTVAAAVFTSGISLAVKAGRTVIQQNQLTLYQVTYDSNGDVQSVNVIPPNIGSEPNGGGGQ